MLPEDAVGRRGFLRSVAGAAVGGALLSSEAAEQTSAPPGYRRLGRTGLNVSVVSFGGHAAFRGYLVTEAIEKGINLIHTSPFYSRGRGMGIFGSVLAPYRDQTYLAVKAFPDAPVVDRCLEILRTDYIDILAPGIQNVRQLKRPGLLGDLAKRKQEGKARFIGIACHTGIAKVLSAALELGIFDVFLLSYNLSNRKELAPLIARAHAQGTGLIGMKSAQGLQSDGGSDLSTKIGKDTVRELLSESRLASVLRRMGSQEEVAGGVAVMRSQLARRSRHMMRLEDRVRRTACGMCGACSICPAGVRVSDILRYAEYATDSDPVHRAYGPEAYQRLGREHSTLACTGCGECERVCPNGLDLRARLRRAHSTLV